MGAFIAIITSSVMVSIAIYVRGNYMEIFRGYKDESDLVRKKEIRGFFKLDFNPMEYINKKEDLQFYRCFLVFVIVTAVLVYWDNPITNLICSVLFDFTMSPEMRESAEMRDTGMFVFGLLLRGIISVSAHLAIGINIITAFKISAKGYDVNSKLKRIITYNFAAHLLNVLTFAIDVSYLLTLYRTYYTGKLGIQLNLYSVAFFVALFIRPLFRKLINMAEDYSKRYKVKLWVNGGTVTKAGSREPMQVRLYLKDGKEIRVRYGYETLHVVEDQNILVTNGVYGDIYKKELVEYIKVGERDKIAFNDLKKSWELA